MRKPRGAALRYGSRIVDNLPERKFLMARRSFAPRGAVRTAAKRKSSWIQYQFVTQSQTATGGSLIFILNTAALALRPFTIIRTHFVVSLASDQAAAQEDQFASFGMAVVSLQAAAVGVSAIPTPFTDMASDLWFVHRNMISDESSLADNPKPSLKVDIDSKAMRKVDIGQDVVVVWEFGSGGDGSSIAVAGRMLVKLH